ncbi:MAG TPA: hypothetical protein VIL20_15030 [Sandaracinaceae bacterium]
MRTIRRAVWPVALVVASLAGCSTFATHEEYGAYRAVRLASSDRDRLIAARDYVQRYSGGYWIEEVQAERRRHEDTVWENGNSTREGLEWYLEVYPDGRYVDQARPRLAALQAVSSRREEQEERQEQLEEERRRQLAEQRRTWVTQAVQFWTRTLLGVRNYGSTITRVAQANPDFGRAFGEGPAPQCQAGLYCIKHYGQLYHIPVPGATRIDRNIDLYLRLLMNRSRLERAELILPNKGFSRWYEMENRTVVTDEDPEQRNTALNWALERVQPVVEEVCQGAQRIDYIPEPLSPLQVRGASTEEAPQAPESAPATGARKQESIDDLLNDAVGADEQEQPPTETPQVPDVPQEPAETLVLPVGLLAWQCRNLRVVVFAASAEDYEQGYDGLFIERIRD